MVFFVAPIWFPSFAHISTIAAKSISWRYGMLNLLKINEFEVSARSPVRLLILVKLVWLPAHSPQHDCHMNEII